MELCLARAAKTTVVLTNSENVPETQRKLLKTAVELAPAWRANHDGSKQRERQRRKFLETLGLNVGIEQSTTAGEISLRREYGSPSATLQEKKMVSRKRRLQAID